MVKNHWPRLTPACMSGRILKPALFILAHPVGLLA